jgi:hypothetical protein
MSFSGDVRAGGAELDFVGLDVIGMGVEYSQWEDA